MDWLHAPVQGAYHAGFGFAIRCREPEKITTASGFPLASVASAMLASESCPASVQVHFCLADIVCLIDGAVCSRQPSEPTQTHTTGVTEVSGSQSRLPRQPVEEQMKPAGGCQKFVNIEFIQTRRHARVHSIFALSSALEHVILKCTFICDDLLSPLRRSRSRRGPCCIAARQSNTEGPRIQISPSPSPSLSNILSPCGHLRCPASAPPLSHPPSPPLPLTASFSHSLAFFSLRLSTRPLSYARVFIF
jgi:hypothetical protein